MLVLGTLSINYGELLGTRKTMEYKSWSPDQYLACSFVIGPEQFLLQRCCPKMFTGYWALSGNCLLCLKLGHCKIDVGHKNILPNTIIEVSFLSFLQAQRPLFPQLRGRKHSLLLNHSSVIDQKHSLHSTWGMITIILNQGFNLMTLQGQFQGLKSGSTGLNAVRNLLRRVTLSLVMRWIVYVLNTAVKGQSMSVKRWSRRYLCRNLLYFEIQYNIIYCYTRRKHIKNHHPTFKAGRGEDSIKDRKIH